MAFRDSQDALRARVEAQEAELAELRARLAAPVPRVAGRGGSSKTWVFGLVAAGVVLWLAAYYLGWGMSGYVGERLGIAVGAAGTVLVLLALVASLIEVVGPNEVLVLSGRRHHQADGRVAGYRMIVGGRALRVPIVERADRMDLRPLSLESSLERVAMRGDFGRLRFRALVELDRDPAVLPHAIERFLGRSREEIAAVAEACLEGAVRGAVSALDRREIDEDRFAVAEKVKQEAHDDFEKLGLRVASLSIVEVE